MLRRVRFALCAACALCLAFALSGCASQEDPAPELKSPTIEPPAIETAGTLSVGVNTSKSPLAGTGNDGRIIGIDVDIAAALADELGLALEIVDVGSATTTALEEGEADIVMGIDSSDSSSEVWLSQQYLPTGVALFALESSNATVPTDAATVPEGMTIAAQVSSKSAWAVSNAFGDEALESTSDLSTAFADLEAGKVDFVASDAVIGMYAANRQGADVKIVALMDSPSGYCIALPTENLELQAAIAEALKAISNQGIIGVIEDKWLGRELDISDVEQVKGTEVKDSNADEASNAADSSTNTSATNSSAA